MAYNLLFHRVLVEPDEGETDRGTVVEGFAPSTLEYLSPPVPPETGTGPMTKVYHYHVVFVTNMAQLVTQGGTDYYCMHRNAILGYID